MYVHIIIFSIENYCPQMGQKLHQCGDVWCVQTGGAVWLHDGVCIGGCDRVCYCVWSCMVVCTLAWTRVCVPSGGARCEQPVEGVRMIAAVHATGLPHNRRTYLEAPCDLLYGFRPGDHSVQLLSPFEMLMHWQMVEVCCWSELSIFCDLLRKLRSGRTLAFVSIFGVHQQTCVCIVPRSGGINICIEEE